MVAEVGTLQTSGTTMPDAAGVTKTKPTALHEDFPQLPGEQVLAHQGSAWWEAAEARLAAKKLLVVAQGGIPPEAESILDVDLASVPELPTEHRDHHRRMETRTKIGPRTGRSSERGEGMIHLRREMIPRPSGYC